jgi:hypothetical protein
VAITAAASPDSYSVLDELFGKEANRPVTINDPSGQTTLIMSEVIIRSMANNAAKGSVLAQRDFLHHLQAHYARNEERARQAKEQHEQDYLMFEQLKERQTALWAEAEAQGTVPERLWPDPEDIILNARDKTWRIRGPYDEEDVPDFEYRRAMRNHLYAQSAEVKRRKDGAGERPSIILFQIACLWNTMLPKRWQHDAHQAAITVLPYYGMPLRQLRQETQRLEDVAMTWKHKANIPEPTPEVDHEVELIFKPLLKAYGYTSLKQVNYLAALEQAQMDAAAKERKRKRQIKARGLQRKTHN